MMDEKGREKDIGNEQSKYWNMIMISQMQFLIRNLKIMRLIEKKRKKICCDEMIDVAEYELSNDAENGLVMGLSKLDAFCM